MKKALLCSLLTLSSSYTYAVGFSDGSDIGTPEMAKCSAAALKIDMKTWEQWFQALEKRYSIIYREKSSKEIKSYTIERVMDKKRALNRLGIDSKRAYRNYFNQNCVGEL